LINGGSISPGEGIGHLDVIGDYSQTPSGSLDIDIAIDDATYFVDEIAIDGTADLAGDLRIALGESVIPNTLVGQELVILTTTKRLTGTFTISERHIGQGVFVDPVYVSTKVTLGFQQAFAGDTNGDGFFLTNDLVAVFQAGKYEDTISMNADWTEGDWNLDGDFTTRDLVAAFQIGRFEQSNAAVAIPEPDSSQLLAFGIVLLYKIPRTRGWRITTHGQ